MTIALLATWAGLTILIGFGFVVAFLAVYGLTRLIVYYPTASLVVMGGGTAALLAAVILGIFP